MIEEIKHNEILLAIIIRKEFHCDGIHFFTSNDSSQQLAYMSYPKGKIIQSHIHNQHKRTIHSTKEILFIRNGKIRVDFYTNKQEYLESRDLYAGDIIFLSDGGHGFEFLEDAQIFEVKQGPYLGDMDKLRF